MMSARLRRAAHLRVLRHPAEDRGDAEADRLGQRGQHGVHLAGELTGGHEHEAARAARTGVAVGEPGGEGDGKAERLAGSGLPAPENVESRECVRQGGGLNGEGRGDTGLGEGGHERRGHTRGGEGGLRGAVWARSAVAPRAAHVRGRAVSVGRAVI